MVVLGRVYKLKKEGIEHCYIGSTYSPHLCIRMCHHRQSHRRGERDYKGLFTGGDPEIEVLEIVELDDKEDASRLRAAEEKWYQQTEHCINLRRCHVSKEEKKIQRDKAIKKYHDSPLGKVAKRKSALNQRLKKNNNLIINDEITKQIKGELKFLTDLQHVLRYDNEDVGVKPYASSYKVS